MPAREITCRVTESIWLTPTVLRLRFEPSRKFHFDPGQFLSVIVPKPFAPPGGPPRLRRIYSLATPVEQGYELSIKQTNGPGPRYLSSLKVGDVFHASAPYGDFTYRTGSDRQACFISTGTGIAPFRAIVLSREFAENPPLKAVSIFGARGQEEILYPGEFAQAGCEEVFALSAPDPFWRGFRGRVTDWLRSLPMDWGWQTTDFYLCGNGEMVTEVRRILRDARGVPAEAIHQEVYFAPSKPLQKVEKFLKAG